MDWYNRDMNIHNVGICLLEDQTFLQNSEGKKSSTQAVELKVTSNMPGK